MVHYLSAVLVGVGVFFLPLAAQQYELPKFALLLSAVGLGLLYMLHLLWKGKWQPDRALANTPWQFWVFLSFLVLHTLFVSIVPLDSLWGSYQRHTGLLLWTAQFLLFLMMVGRRWTSREVGHVLRSLAVLGTLSAVVGILQWLAPTLWSDLASTSGRVFGTLGVPNFFGQMLLLTLCATLLPFFEELHGRRKAAYLWGGMFALQLIGLVLSGNRASLVVLALLILVAFIAFLWKLKLSTDRRVLAAVLLVVGLGSIVWAVGSRTDGFLRSITTRLELYPTAIESIIQQPLLGYGLDTVYSVFTPRLPEHLGDTENILDIPDKVHHIVLDSLMEIGVLGAFLLALLVFALLRHGYLALKQKRRPRRRYIATILLCLTAWGASLLVSFPGIAERVIAIILVALLFVDEHDDEGGQDLDLDITPSRLKIPLSILMLILSGAFVYLGIGTLTADLQFERMKTGATPTNIAALQALTPIHNEYRVFGSNGTFQGVTPESRVTFLQEALQYNPHDIWARTFIALAHFEAGNTESAKQELKEAYATCPRCPFVSVQAAKILTYAGDTAGAQAWAEIYFDLLPSFVMATPAELSEYQKNRRRITIKEQQADILFMLGMLPEGLSQTYREAIFQ